MAPMNDSLHKRYAATLATTLGLFPTTTAAEKALARWLTELLDPKKLSIVVQKRIMLLHMAQYDKLDQVKHSGIIQRAPLDPLAGMLVGIGAVNVPGLGAVLAKGPLAAVVANASGGLADALERTQLPQHAAQQVQDGLRQGQVLLALHELPDGPALMSEAQAWHHYQCQMQLTSSSHQRRTNKIVDAGRESRLMMNEQRWAISPRPIKEKHDNSNS